MLGWTWKSCEEFRYLPHGQVACGGEQPGWRYALYAPDRSLVQIGSQKYLMQNMQNINKIPALTSQLAVLRGCWLEYYTITPNSMLPRTVRDHYSMAGMKLVRGAPAFPGKAVFAPNFGGVLNARTVSQAREVERCTYWVFACNHVGYGYKTIMRGKATT